MKVCADFTHFVFAGGCQSNRSGFTSRKHCKPYQFCLYIERVFRVNMVKFRCHMLFLLQFWIGRSSRFGECFCHAPIILLHIARCKAYRN